ncbi:Retrovirus-related Pol polyprotein [Labeo rohita]|uniref:Retrovirus-related Pol polyprotein n=1 Tax=Labeo rohita TaxID=84645 RepID=A0ABQ8MF20_LABRO|nr:Retrovirus-related Pol polyprotein [Labeo rohita]
MQTLPSLNDITSNTYQPFVFTGTVSLSSESEERQIRILRDTGASHLFVLRDILPFSAESHTDTDVLVCGFGMGCINVPLHRVYLMSDLVTGLVTLGVCSQLPVDGVDLILGNDLAGGQVFPRPIVIYELYTIKIFEPDAQFISVFPVCAVTRAQSQKFGDVTNLSDTVLFSQPEKLVGKPNQTIPVAPLKPIPVIHEPFERLIVDCVGPLPKSKSGHQYILTIMCTATRYPEAIPLRTIKAKKVMQEIIRFCSVFGLPKVIQSDQGSNFTSKVFT